MKKTFIINYSKYNSNNIRNAFNNFHIKLHIANKLLDNSIEIITTQKNIINKIILGLRENTLEFPTLQSYINLLKFTFNHDIEEIVLNTNSTYTVSYC